MQGDKKLNFCKVATALLSVLLLCCTALFPTSYKSAAVAGYCGAILLIDGMCGYVLTAVVTFIIATVITVMCIKIKTGGTENEQKNSVGDIITLHHSLRATDEYSCGARANETLTFNGGKTLLLQNDYISFYFYDLQYQTYTATVPRAIAKETGDVLHRIFKPPAANLMFIPAEEIRRQPIRLSHCKRRSLCLKRRTGKIPQLRQTTTWT